MPRHYAPIRKQFWIDKMANAERLAELDREADSRFVESWKMRFQAARNQLCT